MNYLCNFTVLCNVKSYLQVRVLLDAISSFIYIYICASTLKAKTVFSSEKSTLNTKLQVLSVMFMKHIILTTKLSALHICYYTFLGYTFE